MRRMSGIPMFDGAFTIIPFEQIVANETKQNATLKQVEQLSKALAAGYQSMQAGGSGRALDVKCLSGPNEYLQCDGSDVCPKGGQHESILVGFYSDKRACKKCDCDME